MEIGTDLGLASATPTRDTGAASLGQEDFLRMLIAQLENQDPLNPQESTEFTAQLATFSSLEQEIAMRETLEDISAALSRGDQGTAIDLIGSNVLAESPAFQLGSQGTTLRFDLPQASASTVLEIRDENGSVVRSIDVGGRPAGVSEIAWDGANRAGQQLPAGVYQLDVVATNSDLAGIPATPLVVDRVTGADLSSRDPFLYLGDLVVPMDGVREVRSASGTSAP